jgi:hypothetical protein
MLGRPSCKSRLFNMSTTTTTTTQPTLATHIKAETRQYPEPLKPSGALDAFQHFDVTPVIGREYPKVNLVNDVINAENADELIRDLAITSMFHSTSCIVYIF